MGLPMRTEPNGTAFKKVIGASNSSALGTNGLVMGYFCYGVAAALCA